MLFPRTPEFEAFVAPARPRSQLWRLILGLAVVAVVYIGFAMAMLALARAIAGQAGLMAMGGAFVSSTSPGGMAVLLVTFVGLALGAWAAVRLLHRRGFATLFGPDPARTRRDFSRALLVTLALFGAGLALGLLLLEPVPNLAPGRWLMWLPLALVLVFVQIMAEEVVFRGYLIQQLAARFASPLVWGVAPALLFGAAHWNPADMGGNAAAIVAATALFGLVAADLTARTGNIGAALGIHFANNVSSLLLLSLQGTLTGLALYVTPFGADDVERLRPLIWLDMAGVVVAWWLVRRAVAR